MLNKEEQTNDNGSAGNLPALEDNPCSGCPAPCCQMQTWPYVAPEYATTLDAIRYFLLFPNTELIINKNGNYSFAKWQQCSMFQREKCTCSVHNTAKQPMICITFSGHNCWYKRNFVTDMPVDICRLDLKRFEIWASYLEFDKSGQLVRSPDFGQIQEIIKNSEILPRFEINAGLSK